MSKESHQEIEAKYRDLSPELSDHLASAAQLTGGFAVGEPVRIEHLDVYFDTGAYDLLRRGLALRVRRAGERTLLTVKSLADRDDAAVRRRVEAEAEVSPRGSPPYLKHAPDDLQTLVREHIPRKAKLRPILYLHQQRVQRPVYAARADGAGASGASAAPLAEMSLDEVHVLAGDATVIGDVVAEFRELELELLPGGDVEALEGLAAQLEADHDLTPAAESKPEAGMRALAIAAGDGEHANIQPQMHMAEACRMIWRQQMVEALLQEHGVRHSDDPEYVHDMRVAIRRARTAYDLFGDYFRKKKVKPYIDELRRLGRLLGRVRDLDVTYLHLLDEASTNGEPARAKDSELMALTRRQRAAAHETLAAWLDGSEYAAFIADFMEFCTTPGAGVKRSLTGEYVTQPVHVRHYMPIIIVERFQRVRAYESLLPIVSSVPYEQLHALRIECKFLRYVLEFNRYLLGEPGEALIAQLKTLQDHLGELNDYAVELQRLEKMESGGGMSHAEVERRMTDLSERSKQLRASFPAEFREFVTEENRIRLGNAVATL